MENKNPPNQLTDEARQALLVEYETCQSHNNALGQQSWVSISILITVNLLVLVQVVSSLVLTTVPSHGWARLIFVILLGVVMIIILGIFWRWQKRITFLIWLNNKRMGKIEENLDFTIWKNWRPRGLDLFYSKKEDKQKKWGKLNPKLKAMIKQLSKCYPKKDKETEKDENYETMYRLPTTEGQFCKGQFKFKCIFPALMIVWVIVITLEALACCPTVYPWLFN